MAKFNKGDQIKRTGVDYGNVQTGFIYTVESQVGPHEVKLLDIRGTFDPKLFELFVAAPKAEGAYNPNIGHTTDGGGLQQHSVGGPYPYIVVGIDNPTGLEPGLYYYVQDKAGNRCTPHTKSAEKVIRQAATLASERPEGTTGHPTPGLERSEGYLSPIVTIELNREAAMTLQLMCAHTAGPMPGEVLRELSMALGHGYDVTREKFDVSFITSGSEKFEDGWHKGRHKRGALAVTKKGAA
jgi:hypothetical protein